jgi:dGTPase
MDIKKIMLKYETLYSKYASFDKDAIRLLPYTPDIRPNYYRDIDRIIHSSSYTRYMDKTQVFSFVNNDNVSKRMVHVQLVSKIARTIGRALSLNEDLIEAIALGHDLGHVPFGHVGEAILNEISLKHNEGFFMHNVQSVRELMVLENDGEGKNICVQVLDGILCHNGEFELKEYKPKKKSKEDFLVDYENSYKIKGYIDTLVPMTLEGCVVRVSDMIGYLGRDIEDAIRLDIIKKEDIPKSITSVLGDDNRSIINTIILDIINNSMDKNYIKLSDKIFNAIKELKKFNYVNIYAKANTKEQIEKYKEMFNTLFDKLLNILNKKDLNNNIYTLYLNKMNNDYKNNTSNERIVIDYIAGMTDDYFMKEYKKYQD